MLLRPVCYTGDHRRPLSRAQRIRAWLAVSLAVIVICIMIPLRGMLVPVMRLLVPALPVAEFVVKSLHAAKPQPDKPNKPPKPSKPPKPDKPAKPATGTGKPPAKPKSKEAPKAMEVAYSGYNYRSEPKIDPHNVRGQMDFGTKVTVVETVKGDDPFGRGENTWYRLDNGFYTWAKYIVPVGTAPRCVLPIRPGDFQISSWYALRWGTFHYGIDFAANGGTPILAVQGGTVIAAGPVDNGFGAWMRIRHSDGTVGTYGHIDGGQGRFVPVGTVVHTGQQIAFMGYGQVGFSTGPHLHLAIDRTGNLDWTDPEPVLNNCGASIPR